MADHTEDICNDWHGKQGDKVTFVNSTSGYCTITQDGKNTWPFKEGPPIPIDGNPIIPGGTATAHLKNPLKDGTYTYDVDCCKNQTPKNVTVP
jgi:hypothetical protein